MDATVDGYAADLRPGEAWDLLVAKPDAVLVDVRTRAEWTFVGVADLSRLGRRPVLVEWQVYPAMAPNRDFIPELTAELSGRGATAVTPILFLCRSGVRSRSAATALSGIGFSQCHNIVEGFEGGLDDARHRGTTGGWKAAGLPWTQS